jgi:hypothetical protein
MALAVDEIAEEGKHATGQDNLAMRHYREINKRRHCLRV